MRTVAAGETGLGGNMIDDARVVALSEGAPVKDIDTLVGRPVDVEPIVRLTERV